MLIDGDDLHQTASDCTKLYQFSPELPKNMKAFLNVVKIFPEGNAVLLAEKARVSERTAKTYLKYLQQCNLIKRMGTNRKDIR